MEYSTEYPSVRKVTRGDRLIFTSLVKKFVEKSGDKKLLNLSPFSKKTPPLDSAGTGEEGESKENGADEMYPLIKSILESFLTWVDDDITPWLMDLVGVQTLEEFNALPFDVDIYIIDELVKQDGFQGFFLRAWGLYKKMKV